MLKKRYINAILSSPDDEMTLFTVFEKVQQPNICVQISKQKMTIS